MNKEQNRQGLFSRQIIGKAREKNRQENARNFTSAQGRDFVPAQINNKNVNEKLPPVAGPLLISESANFV